MSATLFALALFGCSDDGSMCQRLEAPASTYQDMTACTARLDEAVQSEAAMRADYPTVYAQCLTSRQLASIGTGTVELSRINVQMASAAD